MSDRAHPQADTRALRRREDRQLVVVIMAFLVVVGGAAIGIVYGWQTAVLGAIWLLGGAVVIGLLWLILLLVERWAGRE
jgi:fatty acid desaturase